MPEVIVRQPHGKAKGFSSRVPMLGSGESRQADSRSNPLRLSPGLMGLGSPVGLAFSPLRGQLLTGFTSIGGIQAIPVTAVTSCAGKFVSLPSVQLITSIPYDPSLHQLMLFVRIPYTYQFRNRTTGPCSYSGTSKVHALLPDEATQISFGDILGLLILSPNVQLSIC